MRWLWYWLGVWKIQRWPRCRECGLKAKWSAFVDWGAADQVHYFYCDTHIEEQETGGEIKSLFGSTA